VVLFGELVSPASWYWSMLS